MNHPSSFPDRLRKAFTPGQRGVVGVVEDLLALCREQDFQLTWQLNQCHIRSLGEPIELLEIPLQKSVFRAILARVPVLCNERVPNSVSLYGGEGELSLATNPPTVFHVVFANTPEEQRVEVRRKENNNVGVKEFQLPQVTGSGSPQKEQPSLRPF
jgi:hypothetical protein